MESNINSSVENTADSKKENLKNIESKLKNKKKIDLLLDISKAYKHTIIAPCIEYKEQGKFKGYYKNMLLLSGGKSHTYTQQRLIQYEHWNEASFFANDISKLPKLPLTFMANGFRFGVLFGFEAHFDEFWMEFKKAKIDVVLVPTASTFSSNERWEHLLNTHSFTNSCYVFRANRIGKIVANDGYEWDFYGHSFVAFGQDILDSLDENEGMLCVELDMNALNELKNSWKFR
ncbi:carbon-nitrogen hydrolase family protein [Helicobacter saguini]|uniref:Carbon-nitrogen hydrolase family protein n=2 Tax=Helicobacter saguini TaxID=1548018 RepID=A0A347VMB8_9HELI|nr:carbon-nitrogen hydrolase family protein [Helicobacter saguini]MWV66794.1 carbon-nitrogen hydrolase family protein [Helicobacter saguini]MWV69145.1 carbon-nitrogen hydrolase family protein [Helicobacter saguini]MWV71300.1 carbon-nitrogen hydrolase family protein [Helicobacter saguini]TLD94242.1 carbon-nitrogen hydrolase family protein [Helicobacter saguini]